MGVLALRRRPSRYGLAALIGAAVLLAVAVSSALSFALGGVPVRATLFGLPGVGLVVAATVLALRAARGRQAGRRRRATRAALLFTAGILLWLGVLDTYTFTRSAGPAVAVASFAACVPTTLFGLLVVRRLDRNEKEPWLLVLIAVAWGAIVSTSLVIWAESLWDAVFSSSLLPGPALDTSNAYSAGLLEELAKGTAVVLLYLVMREEFDNVVDGIVYGAAVGLGFNFMESLTYMTHMYALFASQGTGAGAAAAQWYFRQVLGLFPGHATYTALIGAGLGVARQLTRRRRRALAVASGFLIAIAAHFAWDAWQQFFPIASSPLALIEIHLRTVFMQGPFTAMVLVLLAMGLQIEGAALERQLRAEAETGLGAVLPAEVPVLVSPWRRLELRLAAAGHAGPAAYVRLGRLQSAQLDLAMQRWHRERDELDEPPDADDALRARALALR